MYANDAVNKIKELTKNNTADIIHIGIETEDGIIALDSLEFKFVDINDSGFSIPMVIINPKKKLKKAKSSSVVIGTEGYRVGSEPTRKDNPPRSINLSSPDDIVFTDTRGNPKGIEKTLDDINGYLIINKNTASALTKDMAIDHLWDWFVVNGVIPRKQEGQASSLPLTSREKLLAISGYISANFKEYDSENDVVIGSNNIRYDSSNLYYWAYMNYMKFQSQYN